MKVVVREVTGWGGSDITVYKYSKKEYIKAVKDEYEWAKKNNCLIDGGEVEELLYDVENGGEPYDVSIINTDEGIHYNICEVKGW